MAQSDTAVVGRLALPPIKFGGFHLSADGLTIHGKPDFGDFENALGCAVYLEDKAPFWKADLLEYAYGRADWAGLIDAVVDAGTFTKRTIDQMRYVARSVPAENRVEGVHFAHHATVAALPAADQRKYLKQAKDEHLSVSELKSVLRREKMVTRVLKGQSGELAHIQGEIVRHAWAAVEACKLIARSDSADAEDHILKARGELEACEMMVARLRKAQGK